MHGSVPATEAGCATCRSVRWAAGCASPASGWPGQLNPMDSNPKHIFSYGTLFEDISVLERQWIMTDERLRVYEAGNVIFGEGDRATDILCVVEGTVKVYKHGFDHDQILAFLGRSDFFGYFEWVDNQHNHSVTAEALSHTAVYSLPLRLLRRILDQNPAVALSLYRDANRRLSQATMRLVALTQKHVRGRVADMLLMLIHTFGRDLNSGRLNCTMPRRDMANIACMTEPNVIRTLRAFHDEGVIRIEGRSIFILHEEGLRRISARG